MAEHGRRQAPEAAERPKSDVEGAIGLLESGRKRTALIGASGGAMFNDELTSSSP